MGFNSPAAWRKGEAIAINKKTTLITIPIDINRCDTDCLGDFIGTNIK
jgi:hypothetical protein